jgi:CHAD domain-containing protein
MPYRLDLSTDAPAAVRDVAGEQLADAIHRLRDDRDDEPVKAVHEARKDLKKTRSLLRLARPGMDRDAYRRENRTLRDAGRALSGARDADVLVEVAEDLAARYDGQLPESSFAALRDALAEEARAARADDRDDAAGEVIATLEGVAVRTADWPLDGCDHDALVAGAARAYRRGSAALAAARDEPDVERLHDLRKRVKDLWYHARLLEEAWPRMLKAEAKAAHELSDLLGDDHDLAVLAERVRGGTFVDDAAILELIARRRTALQDEALRLARRLYAEPPKAFRRRLRTYVRLGGAERTAAA